MTPIQTSLFDQSPQREFIPEPHDWKRWKGHRQKIFTILRDGQWHTRTELLAVSGGGVASRVSELRTRGYEIECDRLADSKSETTYRIIAFVGVSTTNPVHCDTCTCSGVNR